MSAALHPLTLSFLDVQLESDYQARLAPHVRAQARTALGLGLILYALSSVLDLFVLTEPLYSSIWLTRGITMAPIFAVWLLTWHPWFDRKNSALLASTGLYAGLGMILFWTGQPADMSLYYYPGMVLVIFFTYNFVGARFIHALGVNVSLLLIYNLVFGMIQPFPAALLVSQDFFFLAANLIGALTGYLNERQHRVLYLRELKIDRERTIQAHRALHDRLTGLPNRESLFNRLEQQLVLALRDRTMAAGYFIDLDGFKEINDTYGHEAGDRLLQLVAARLVATVRQADALSRLGGDEFFVLAHHVGNAGEALALGDKMIARLREPFLVGEPAGLLRIGATVGICLFPYPGVDASDIIRRADQAMYRGKQQGKNRAVLYESEAAEPHYVSLQHDSYHNGGPNGAHFSPT